MGLTERHWFEDEDCPEKAEWELEDAIYARRQDMVIRREEILSVLDAARMCNLIAYVPYIQLHKLIARLPEEIHCGMIEQGDNNE